MLGRERLGQSIAAWILLRLSSQTCIFGSSSARPARQRWVAPENVECLIVQVELFTIMNTAANVR